MQNRIIINKKEIQEVINKIRDSKNIIFIPRNDESGKNPFSFFSEIGIDFTDAINIIKGLSYKDYQYTLLDSKNKFTFMYVFNKSIRNVKSYIKIGFKSDKTVVISFHKKMFED